MPTANYGALGATFKITRALQVVSMVAIIGMTANFISQMVGADATPPSVLIGTLSVVSIAVLYCAITVILFLDNFQVFFINTAIDCLFLIALIVVSVIVGKPVSYLNCQVLADISSSSSSAYDFTSAISSSLTGNNGMINYSDRIGTSKATCLEVKSVWGLCIALCVLFTFSAISSVALGLRARKMAPQQDKAAGDA